MVVSVLFRIDQNGHIEVVDSGPAPAVTVDTDGHLHAETGIITHAGEDQDGELWRWLPKDTRPARFRRNLASCGRLADQSGGNAATNQRIPRTSTSLVRRPGSSRWSGDRVASWRIIRGRAGGDIPAAAAAACWGMPVLTGYRRLTAEG